ncbi:MAG TPA: cytochrome c, partial [Candidatus Thermoplasmatota archaeon]
MTAGLSMVVAGSLGAALASDSAHLRHEAMETVQDSFMPLRAIAVKEAPFDAAAVKKNATTILEKLKEAHGLFPEGSDGGESRAKAEIWSDRAGFDQAMKDAQAAAAALAAVTDEAAYGDAVKALGGRCKGCHDKYRLPK